MNRIILTPGTEWYNIGIAKMRNDRFITVYLREGDDLEEALKTAARAIGNSIDPEFPIEKYTGFTGREIALVDLITDMYGGLGIKGIRNVIGQILYTFPCK